MKQSIKAIHAQFVETHGQDAIKEISANMSKRPVTLWLTGLSGAGKSTLALALEKSLIKDGRACYVLDGDKIRLGLNQDLGFSVAHRSENIRRVAEVAKLMNEAGLIVIVALISPYKSDRERARKIIGADEFFEVYLSTPIRVCEQRDAKGLYKKARAGDVQEFTGISASYEVPRSPAVCIDTSTTSVSDALMLLRKLLP